MEKEKVVTKPVEQVVKETKAIVFDCEKLRVREEPSRDAHTVCIVKAGEAFVVDESKSSNKWCKVVNAAGIEGYCMRKYLKF